LDFKINSEIAIKWFKGKMRNGIAVAKKKKRVGIGRVANRFQDETFPDSRVFQFAYLESSLTLVIEFSFS